MSEAILTTPFHQWHQTHNARMVPFAGWEMPIQYSTIVAEHQAVRKTVGLFDISHMGRLWFRGDQAQKAIETLTTCSAGALSIGRVKYAMVLNENAGIIDDILVYRTAEAEWLLVVNASNRLAVLDQLQRLEFADQVEDATQTQAMLAIQGPKAFEVLSELISVSTETLKYYRCVKTEYSGEEVLVSRTGYTGETGLEVIGSNDLLLKLADQLVPLIEKHEGALCGLGCRDTLRLEAGMPLYGHELDLQTTPLEADLEFAISWKNELFVGHEKLVAQKQSGIEKRRVALVMEGKRAAREGVQIFLAGEQEAVGQITSGTYSPTLEHPIAMGYLPVDLADSDVSLEVDLRGKRLPIQRASLPFYSR